MPISPKYFFRLNKSLHLFEMHCAFLPLLNPNIDLLQAVKVSKSGHHLSHDRASKGYGSTPCLTSQTSLHACLQRLNMMQISLWRQTRNRPMPLLARSCERWWLDFVTFTTQKKSRLSLKRRSAFPTGAKIYLSKKIFWVYGHFNININGKGYFNWGDPWIGVKA